MPIFATQRGRRGVPSVPVTWSSVIVWLSVLLTTSYRSMCSFRGWKASTAIAFKGASGFLDVRQPDVVAWRELYLMDRGNRTRVEHKHKPRTWPADYDSIPQTRGSFTQVISITQEDRYNVTLHKLREFPPSCKPRSDWHTHSFQNCNLMHEVDIASGLGRVADTKVKYGFAGATRESWLLDSSTCPTIILKTLRYREEHDELIFEKQRIDALISERLTSSPHVINIYGFCGTSALNQFADGGMFASTFRHMYSDGGNYTDRELLVLARDAALGLADIHDIDGRGNVTSIVHHDLRAENFLTSNGTIMISDFNNGQLLRWDFEKNKRCYGFDWSGGCGKTMEQTNRKAPEECLEERNRTLTTEKTEVYRFGAFLYYIISAGNWTYSYERLPNRTLGRPDPKTVRKMILSGKQPSLPPYIKECNSTDIKAIVRAMRMAHTYDTTERPSARDIADYLEKAARKAAKSPSLTTVKHKATTSSYK